MRACSNTRSGRSSRLIMRRSSSQESSEVTQFRIQGGLHKIYSRVSSGCAHWRLIVVISSSSAASAALDAHFKLHIEVANLGSSSLVFP